MRMGDEVQGGGKEHEAQENATLPGKGLSEIFKLRFKLRKEHAARVHQQCGKKQPIIIMHGLRRLSFI